MIAPISFSTLLHVLNARLLDDSFLALFNEDIDDNDAGVFDSVSIDTRTMLEGALFFAIDGEQYKGVSFAKAACDKGASAIVLNSADKLDINVADFEIPILLVENTRIAMGQLAKFDQARFQGMTVALTGSSGKTTVKEMIASILSQIGATHATLGNLNNELGVPLTIFNRSASAQYSVVELGASAKGEIAYTASIVNPDVVTITNIGSAHIEGFGSELGIAQAKTEIVKGLLPSGVFVFNADDKYANMWHALESKSRKISASMSDHQADIFADQLTLDHKGCYQFVLHANENQCFIQLALPGKHNVCNALLAAGVAMQCGAQFDDIQQGLANMSAVKGRLECKQGIHDSILIDDTYNANPASVKAAIDVLASSESTQKWLILGAMGELGENAARFHQEVGDYAKAQGIDRLVAVGKYNDQTTKAWVSPQAINVTDNTHAVHILKEELAANQKPVTLLFKGSRSAKIEEILNALLVG